MSEFPRNLFAFQEACHTMVSDFNDFWLLAGLTDQSYEDGVKKPGFPKAVEAYEKAGVHASLLGQLRNGINGNLLDILQRKTSLCDVARQSGKGQDLTFTDRVSGRAARVEVKLLFDCSVAGQYPRVAADREKLLDLRATPTDDDLFVAVFFHQMPHYDYPKRSGYLRRCGIPAQFAELRRHFPGLPAWPTDGPRLHPLAAPSPDIAEILLKRGPPRSDWQLDLKAHLRDAAVGVAIWQIP